MSDRIEVLVPSRSRPENVLRLARAWQDTTTGIARLHVFVDDDDPRLGDYENDAVTFGYSLTIGPRARLVGWTNRAAPTMAVDSLAVGSIGDDHLPVTPGWDRLVRDALLELGTGVVYGDDRFQRERLPTAAFVTSDIVRAIGYMAPPELVHLYCDNFWLALGNAVGIRYLPDVVIEHVHPQTGRAAWDAVYEEANTSAADRADHAAYNRYMTEQFPIDVEKIKAGK